MTSSAIDKKLENKLEIYINLEIKLEIYKNLENKLEIYSYFKLENKLEIFEFFVNGRWSQYYYGSDLNFSLFWDFCAQFQKKYWKQDKPGEYVVGHHRLSFEGKNHEFFLKILSFFPEPLIMYNLSKTLEFWKFGVR